VGRRFGLATRVRRRAANGGARQRGADRGQRRLGRDRGRMKSGWPGAGPKGRAERVGFGGSEGETKMGRATKWAESQGGCRNYFQIYFKDFDSNQRVLNILKPNLN
jgi:hypothetical protein